MRACQAGSRASRTRPSKGNTLLDGLDEDDDSDDGIMSSSSNLTGKPAAMLQMELRGDAAPAHRHKTIRTTATSGASCDDPASSTIPARQALGTHDLKPANIMLVARGAAPWRRVGGVRLTRTVRRPPTRRQRQARRLGARDDDPRRDEQMRATLARRRGRRKRANDDTTTSMTRGVGTFCIARRKSRSTGPTVGGGQHKQRRCGV